ncbi:MAG: hypothetical protein SF182_07990 [Deltaproteobacteria bacterium]|nr:hypothetical protein [Deltaproteobacteria bacterium]
MRGIVRQGLGAVIGIALAVAAPASATDITAVGKAKLGMSVDEVKKIYPKMEQLRPDQVLGAQTIMAEDLVRYVVHDTSAPALTKPGDVELRFWKGKLWAFIVYYKDNDPKQVEAAISKQLGPQTGKRPTHPFWKGTAMTAMLDPDGRWYSLTDDAISKDAQAWFIERVRAVKGANVVQTTPAAESAAPAAPPAAPAAKP